MANARKRISELPPLDVASLDTTYVLGISGSTTYKISINNLTSSLDTTFATDLVTATLSNTLDTKLSTSSFNQYTASAINGTISGSSQLTSSFDQRYVVSGSITQTTWDNIANKPSGIVSQSTDLSSLNTFTQSIDSRVDSLESWSSSLTDTFATDLEVSIVSSSVAATIGIISQNTGLVSTSSFNQYTSSISTASLVDRLNTIENVSGSWITESETGSFLTSLNGAISSSEQVLGNSGVYSSSAQINGNIYSAGSSITIQDLLIGAGTTSGKVTTDGSKYISIMPTYNVESARFWTNGNVTIQNAGDYVDNGFRLEVSGSTRIVGPFVTTDGITGSTNFDTIVNKPTLISGSQQIADLGFVTGSYTTINSFNSLTQSFNSISQSFTTISSSVGGVDFNGIVSGSSQVSYIGLSNIPAGIISGSSQLDGTTITNLTITNLTTVNQTSSVLFTSGSNQLGDELADIQTLSGSVRVQGSLTINGTSVSTQSFVDVSALNSATSSYETKGRSIISSSAQITTLGFVSGSYLTSLSGAISSSSQLTSSYDTRYVISGSVGATPSGTISGSAQITAFGFISSSQTINTASLATTGSNSFNGNQTITGSLIVSTVAVVNGGITIPTGSVITFTSGSSISVDSSGAITGSLTGSVFGIGDVVAFSASVNSRILSGSAVSGTVSGSSQLTSSYDSRYVLSGSITQTTWDNIASKPSGIISGSSQLPIGLISGSSQLTASYDTRYTLSGSVVSGTTPAGTISGSSQLTSSFDGRYTQTGSFNTLTASFNSFTASAQSVTTGSNSFNGTQTITGSLIITTGSFVASQILANTASLYLTSGSNLYVQNNGVVEITGSLIVSGSTTLKVPVLYVGTGSGFEGGEIDLAYAQSGSTTLTGSAIVFDVYGDKIRIFENGGTNRGGYFDISTLTAGVGTDLSKLTYFIEAYANVSYTLPGSYTEDVCRYSVVSANLNVPTSWFNTSTYTFTPLRAGYWEIIASYDVYRNGEASLLIKKNGTSVVVAGAISSVTQQITKIIYMNGSTDYINVYNNGVSANARTQSSTNAFFQARYVGA